MLPRSVRSYLPALPTPQCNAMAGRDDSNLARLLLSLRTEEEIEQAIKEITDRVLKKQEKEAKVQKGINDGDSIGNDNL